MKKATELSRIKEILSEFKYELQRKFGIKSIGIFGSYVRGEQTKISDIDIMVEFERPIGWEIVDLHEYLEEILGIKVDLVSKGSLIRKPLLWKYIKAEMVDV